MSTEGYFGTVEQRLSVYVAAFRSREFAADAVEEIRSSMYAGDVQLGRRFVAGRRKTEAGCCIYCHHEAPRDYIVMWRRSGRDERRCKLRSRMSRGLVRGIVVLAFCGSSAFDRQGVTSLAHSQILIIPTTIRVAIARARVNGVKTRRMR